MEDIVHQHRRITLPKPGLPRYESEGLPDWDIDIPTDWEGAPREPLRIHCTDSSQKGWVYVHEAHTKMNDGLFLPNIYAGVRKLLDWNSPSVRLCWDRSSHRLRAAVDRGAPTKKPAFLLHLVVQSLTRDDWPLKVVKEVFRACPEAIALGDIHVEPGYLPLHFACKARGKESYKVIRFLLKMYPQAAQDCLNEKDELPIHILLRNHDLVRSLVEAFPDSLKKADKQGDLPVHVAARGYACALHNFRFLVEAFPESLQKENKQGDLPLHEAIRGNQSFPVLQYLMEQSPQALRHPNSPIHLAISLRRDQKILLALIRPYPQVLVDPGKEETRVLLQTLYPQKISRAVLEFAHLVKEEMNLCKQLEWIDVNCRNMGELLVGPPPLKQQRQQQGPSGNRHHYHECIQPILEWTSFQLESIEKKAREVTVALEQNRLRLEEVMPALPNRPYSSRTEKNTLGRFGR